MTDQTRDAGDDELLSAYLDNELPSADADRLTERLAREPALARRLEALRGSDAATRELFARVDTLPMPQGVLDLLQPHADDENATSGGDNVITFPRRGLRQFMQAPVAIAASVALAAGFLVDRLLDDAPDPVAALYAQTIPADSAVYGVLENGLSGEALLLADGTEGRLLLTFEDSAGDWCRQLAIDTRQTNLQALACRRDGRWQTEALAFGAKEPGGYQQASGSTPAAMNGAIDRLIGESQPVDQKEESTLIAAGWKKTVESPE